MPDLHLLWLRLSSGYTSDRALQEKRWQELEQLYNSPGRHYHTLQHLRHLFQLTFEQLASIAQPRAFQFAIFYHDAVYDPTRQDNEVQSAALARTRLPELGVPAAEVAHVSQLILATREHLPQSLPDANLLLDFDLAILGAPGEQYQKYSQQIREEYRMFPDVAYRQGRRKVLQHFLSREHLYHTPIMRGQLEQQARQNLKQEMRLLEG
ncbi:putative metal-dependent HD superfamily phosphohydrolase [Pontibacter mucosus]|uniref:Putative metal-dependent HD superfamily phosphohydrolase n=1 Tax=Pontibacter mucosus TaxID=1649266 RepID=A0A2T5YDF4_9BACT|nr:hypothetical protein [Pontibacter mucosus]PTX14544.1 putative metal-dependent HD superfamily phosphohydrolase [Pontibacter mucosus]